MLSNMDASIWLCRIFQLRRTVAAMFQNLLIGTEETSINALLAMPLGSNLSVSCYGIPSRSRHDKTQLPQMRAMPSRLPKPRLNSLTMPTNCVEFPPAPFVPAEAGTQFLRQSLGPRIRGDERKLMQAIQ